MAHPLPPDATISALERHAQELLEMYRQNPSLCAERIARRIPDPGATDFDLARARQVVAAEYGFASFAELDDYLQQNPPERQIFTAVAAGDVYELTSLLQADARLIDARGGWQLYRPLFFAEQNGQKQAAEALRQFGATLDVFEAAALGAVDELRRILNDDPQQANATRSHYDGTPLHAVRAAGTAAARVLIEFGADVNAVDSSQQQLTALHGRAEHGDLPMVELLLSHGADVQAVSCMGTPLHCAVGGFQEEPAEFWQQVAERLLAAGADINADSAAGPGSPVWTALHHAAWRNHPAAVRWLLQQGADPTIMNSYGATPKQTAQYFDHREVLELFSDATE